MEFTWPKASCQVCGCVCGFTVDGESTALTISCHFMDGQLVRSRTENCWTYESCLMH